MAELKLVKLHEDGEHLVLQAPDGTQFALAITEEIRAAVRRDRAHLEQLRADHMALPPREIQARLRAGHSVESVAAAAGMSPEQIRRYAGPVTAEQEYVIHQVRHSVTPHGHTLDEYVAMQLLDHTSAAESIVWSATREGSAPWLVTALFEIGAQAFTAQWSYLVASRTLSPLDEEAQWLSGERDRPHSDLGDETPGVTLDYASTPEQQDTEDLLEELSSRRGLRSLPPEEDTSIAMEQPFDTFDPPLIVEIGSAGGDVVAFTPRADRSAPGDQPAPATSTVNPQDAVTSLGHPEPSHTTSPASERPARKGRAKVPSLDEIVFGAKPRT